ncbi:hypothetical protein MBAV_002662 [Candidatus Magnetobacterium bavaricum]|uniref:Uncharacterized protein n=1 Tax=Candidatus Magnetobacterium bavaricum TaxID=29290 RepID=A0A0F3GTF9_9BACT|nr:hypothetical protein MBAV_002662 [Candidatus Magnetobacterium bavaricum]
MTDQNKETLYGNDLIIETITGRIAKLLGEFEKRITLQIESIKPAKKPPKPSKLISAPIPSIAELQKYWDDDNKDEIERILKSLEGHNVGYLRTWCSQNGIEKVKSKTIRPDVIKAIRVKIDELKKSTMTDEEREQLEQKFNEYSERWASGKDSEKAVIDELESYSEQEIRRLFDANHLEVNGELKKTNMLKAIYAAFRERRWLIGR